MTYTKAELRVLRELTPGYLALIKHNPGGVKGYINRTYLVWFDWFPPKREEWMDDDEYGWKKDRQKKVTKFSFSSSPVKCLIHVTCSISIWHCGGVHGALAKGVDVSRSTNDL